MTYVAADRLPPHNIVAEEAVLGSALIDSAALEKIARKLSANDFYRERNRWVWEAMMACRSSGEAADHLTVAAHLEAMGRLEETGGPAYLSHIVAVTPTSVHAEHYAGIVHRTALQRSAISSASEIADLAYGEHDPGQIGEEMLAAGLSLMTGNDAHRHLRPIAEAITEHWNVLVELYTQVRPFQGISTGFRGMDLKVHGIKGRQLIVIGARPSIGKSQLMLTMALRAAAAGHRVQFYSLEMSEQEMVKRLISIRLARNVMSLPADQRLALEADIIDAMGWVGDLPIDLTEAAAFTTDDIRAQVLQAVRRESGPALVFVDYLHLLDDRRERGDSVASHVGHMTRRLKRLAMEANTCVVVASQLNRETEHGNDLRPSLRHLRDSGSIEADADVVALLYRQDYYVERGDIRPDPSDGRYSQQDQRTLEINIAKQREGPVGIVKLYYDPYTSVIADFDHTGRR